MTEPRLFALDRREDVTGASGTGRVALGVQWPDGTCVIRWQTDMRSTAIYDNVDELEAIHGHDGRTVVVWLEDKANGRTFWADHFHEVEAANRAALGAHHKSGHTVAELITGVVGAVDRLVREQGQLQGEVEELETQRDGLTDAIGKYRELLGAIWLHVGWRSITRQLTTDQRELWAHAVESSGDPDTMVTADRWWRDGIEVK